ncbi:MAG: hypothetical protein WAW06_04040 [bacterium]
MSNTRRVVAAAATGLAAFGWLVLFSGCSDKAGGIRESNKAPDTEISFGPMEETRTYFKVQVYWFGKDDDGTVARYEFATLKGVTKDSLENVDLNALAYDTTSATERTFVLTADEGWVASGTAKMALSYWAIVVRAIDNDGAADPSPKTLVFQASNIIPRVKMAIPPKLPIRSMTASKNAYVEWEGADPDGEAGELQYKYIIAKVRKSDYPGPPNPPPLLPDPEDSNYVYVDSLHVGEKVKNGCVPIGYWSEWVPADCTYIKDLNLSWFVQETGYFARVCVTCKDEGEAMLPQVLFGNLYNGDNNWVMLTVLAQGGGVVTRIDGASLGTRRSDRTSDYINTVAGLFAGTEVEFKFWGAEVSDEGKFVQEYRYYYDDPEDPRTSTWNYWTSTAPIRDKAATPQWLVRYPPDGEPFVPTLGPHVFVVECRDLNKDPTHCEFRLEVLQGPVGKPSMVYLVDDEVSKWIGIRYAWAEQGGDSLWSAILDPYSHDVFDTGDNPASPFKKEVPVRRVADATTVIWSVDQDTEMPDCQLTSVCFDKGNYLNSYVKVGGNLIIIGRDPVYACQFWPDKTPDKGVRSDKSVLEFFPKEDESGDTMYNFLWDVFGIAKIAASNPDAPTSRLCPCVGWLPEVSTGLIPGVRGWPGKMESILYIANLRNEYAGEEDFPVEKLYTAIPLDDQGNPTIPDCGSADCDSSRKWVGVYVPAHGGRGHAAYISIPPWYFDHDQVRVMIQALLDRFGEPRRD